ncbi:MAG: hypothetical protein ACLR2G_09920 [Phascolarctobacterium faecium]
MPEKVREYVIAVAMDDWFRYSSLNMLKDLSIDKADRAEEG